MNCIDLTLSEEEEIIFVKKNSTDHDFNHDSNTDTNNDIFHFFYGVEDLSQKYLSIQHPINRKFVKPQYSIDCPKCHQSFLNCHFVNHIIDHYKSDYSTLDSLLSPKLQALSNTIFNDTNQSTAIDNQRNCYRCEICCLDFRSIIGLGQHLESKHVYQDMPYVCFVCNFYRTSILSQLKQHFHDNHKSTEYLICPFCIQSFELSQSSSSSSSSCCLDATAFLTHIEKHLSKKQFACDKCVLKFTTKLALIFHKTVYHDGKPLPVASDLSSVGSVASSANQPQKIIKKSLNASTNQPIDIARLTIGSYRLPMNCVECREYLSTNLATHFQSFNLCSHCGFRSYCVAAFRRHNRLIHNFQSDSNVNQSVAIGVANNSNNAACNANNNNHNHTSSSGSNNSNCKSIDIYQRGVLICSCGYQSMHGDSMASHLYYYCPHKTCVTRSRIIDDEDHDDDDDNNDITSTNCNSSATDQFFGFVNLQKKNSKPDCIRMDLNI